MAIRTAAVANVSVSVVVCTHMRNKTLSRTLESIANQTMAAHQIIVVENGTVHDETKDITKAVGATYIHEPVRGLDFARNAALAASGGTVVSFIDDDAVASTDWIEQITNVFESGGVSMCTGKVVPLTLETPAQRMFESNGGLNRGDHAITLPAEKDRPINGHRGNLIAWGTRIGVGCNMSVTREHVRGIGGFDEALDLGAGLPGGGDIDMAWRLLQAGHTVTYRPSVKVFHEHRRDYDSMARQIIGHQRALLAFLDKAQKQATGKQSREIRRFRAWRRVKPLVRLVRAMVGGDPLPTGLLFRMLAMCSFSPNGYARALRIATGRRATSSGESS